MSDINHERHKPDGHNGQPPTGRNRAEGGDIFRNANGVNEREDDMVVEPDGRQDQDLLATIEDAIVHRHGHHAGDTPQADTNGAGGPIAAFSAQLAATLPRMDEHFHDELLARLIQELPEPVDAQSAGQVSMKVSPTAQSGTTQAHLPQRSPGRFYLPGTHTLSDLIGRLMRPGDNGSRTQVPPERKRGWGDSVVTALAGMAVLLLVVVGMAVTIKVRQDASQSSKDAQASLTQTTTAKGSSDTLNLVANLQSLSILTATGTIVWSRSGSNLLTSGLSYGNMQTWDIASGKLLNSVKTGEGDIRAWASDARMLAIVHGRTVTLLDSTTGQALRSWNAPEQIYTLAWSPNSMKLATGPLEPNGVVRIWDTTGKELLSLSNVTTPYSAYAPALAWSPDGSVLAVGDGLTAAQLWDTSSGKLVRSIGADYQNRTRTILALTPSPTPLPTPAYRDVGGGGLPGLAWSPDGGSIATSLGRIVTVWDATSGQALHTIGAPVPYDDYTSLWDSLGWVSDLAWSPDSKVLAVANGSLTFWDIATGNLLRTLPGTEPSIEPIERNQNRASRLATQASWSPDGRKLAVGFGFSDKTEIWGEGTNTITTPLPNPSTISDATPTRAIRGTVPPDCGAWQIVPSAVADLYNQPMGVAATSADDAWVVGFHSDKPVSGWLADAYHGQDNVHTLIEHWDGSNWNIMPSPDAGDSSYLFGVTAVDKTHAWAVGYNTTTGNVQRTLILSWNGTNWQVVPSPNVSAMNNRLIGVTSLGPDNVWAVGSSGTDPDFNSGPSQTLILHFDGKVWSIVPSPSPSIFDNHLTAVSAAAADDVWAVGFQNPEQDRMGFLVLHWNGSVWTMVPQQTETEVAVIGLSGVAATASGAWVTGGWTNIGGGSWQVGHYATDGRSDGTSPDLRTGEVADVYLSGVIARSLGKATVPGTSGTLDSVWAVGSIADNKGGKVAPPDLPPHDTLVVHWDGKVWSTPASPSVSGQDNQLSAIAAVPGPKEEALWAVGFSSSDSASRPLILRYSTCTILEPTASGSTSTPVTPVTRTSALPARTSSSPPSPSSIPSPSLPPASVPDCGLTWSAVPVASSGRAGGPNQGPFTGVAAISANDVWAVGYGSTAPSNALIAHWDGSSWSMVVNPIAGAGDNKLYGVAATGAKNVWAVGSYSTDTTGSKPLIIHWDGSAWKVDPGPDPGLGLATLYAAAAISPNDVWAVGSYQFDGNRGNADPNADTWKSQTLIEHWDGTRWSIVSSRGPGNLNNILSAVAAVSSNDIWAVGSYEQQQTEPLVTGKTLILHWDGSSWAQVSSPDVQTWIDGLSGVAARSTDDVWAVGSANNGEHVDPLTMHWDGKQWSIVPSPPSTSHDGGSLSAVAILSATDVWAVGGDYSPTAMHWNGSRWEGFLLNRPSADGKIYIGWLAGVVALSPTEIWAAGGLQDVTVSGNLPGPLLMHYGVVPCVPPNPPSPVASAASPAKTVQTATPGPSPEAVCRTWSLVADVDIRSQTSSISSAAAVSPNDIWAVGMSGDLPLPGGQPASQSLTMHWDGTRVQLVPNPNVSGGSAEIRLAAVAAVSKGDVWTVGSWVLRDQSAGKTLTTHWDGKEWSEVPSPNNNGDTNAGLLGIAAVSSNDVWAVGSSDYGRSTYIIHWDGKEWSEVRSPNVGQSVNVLTATAFTSKSDGWAVGYYSNSIPTYSTLTMHWDGTAWSVVPSPNIPHTIPGLTNSKLLDVVALGKDDVWSMGTYDTPTNGYSSYTFTMMQHWDGASWNILMPGTRSIGAQLTSLAAFGPNDIWALGPGLAVAHWDGSTWDEVRKPDYYGQATGIEKALALSSGEILTLGHRSDGHVLIGDLVADVGACNASEIYLVAPPTPTFPPPVPTSVP